MTKTYSEHRKRIIIKPFPYTVYLIASNNVMESRNRYNKRLGPYNGVPADGLHVCIDNVPASWLFMDYQAPIGVVTHEVLHVLWRLFDYIGAKLEEEIMAYHIGNLTEEVCLFLHKTEQAMAKELDKLAKER
jgi:hypothetical protein